MAEYSVGGGSGKIYGKGMGAALQISRGHRKRFLSSGCIVGIVLFDAETKSEKERRMAC